MGQRDLVAVFRGVDRVTPVMNQINGGLTNTARISQEASSHMAGMGGMLSREWEKFRRTFGYAFAGAATYKVFQAFQNLKQYNSELGQLNAMLPMTQTGLDQIGEVAMRVSSATGAPLNDVQQSINNIVQSIPDMSAAARRHLIPAMAQIEAMSSRIMDVDPRSFGSTVLGIARAYNPIGQLSNPSTGPQILEKIASQLYITRTTTPRLTGQDITQYIPTLVGGARAGRFSLPEALALFSVAQQTIQRPATTTQYLRQLMLRIRKPTKQELPFFEQAGLQQSDLANLSGMEILNRLIQHGLSLPGGVGRKQLQEAVRSGDYKRIAATGPAAQFFQNAIGGRMQSLVAITALASNYGQIRLQQDRLAKNSNDINQAFERWKTRNALGLMSNAMANTTTDLLQNFMPALGLGATHITDLANTASSVTGKMRRMDRHVNDFILGHLVSPGFAKRHNIIGATLDPLLTIGGIAAIMKSPAIWRRFGVGEFLKSGFGRRAMEPLLAAETASAATAALAGKAMGTPAEPFWVVIHPLSMSTVHGLFGGGGGSNPLQAEEKAGGSILKWLAARAGAAGLGARMGLSAADVGLASTGIGLPVAALLLAVQLAGKTPQFNSNIAKAIAHNQRHKLPGSVLSGNLDIPLTQAMHHISQLDRGRVSRASHGVVAHGAVEATFNLEPTQELKGLLKPQQVKAHVPTRLWDLSASPPTERGKAKVTRNK